MAHMVITSCYISISIFLYCIFLDLTTISYPFLSGQESVTVTIICHLTSNLPF